MRHIRSAWAPRWWGVVVGAGALLAWGSLFAQGTAGKVEGTVKDRAGAPVAGAQVLIVGAAFNATTDAAGYFFLNNVPAGVVTVRAQFIGYAPSEVREVRVLAGQTATVSPVLEPRALELAPITVTVQANPIVPRDQVASKPTVLGDAVERLPVDRLEDVLALQPGVVEGARGLSIRGSRPGTEATYVDGVLVRNFQGAYGGVYGTSGLATNIGTAATVGTNALQEVSVTTGAVGAGYAQAEGGVVSLVTRAGGTAYHGSASFSTDNVSGQVYGAGLSRLEASLGGPVARNLTFFLATTLQGQQNALPALGGQRSPQFVIGGSADSVMVPLHPYLSNGTTPNPTSDSQLVRLPRFEEYASACRYAAAPPGYAGSAADPVRLSPAEKGSCPTTRLANANSDQTAADAKLQYTYGAGSRLALTYHWDRNQGLDSIYFNPVRQNGKRALASVVVANWTQNLATGTDHAVVVDASLSWQRDQYVYGLVQPAWVEGHQDPFAWYNPGDIQFITDFRSFPIDGRLIEDLRLGACDGTRDGGIGACIPYYHRTDLKAGSAYRFNPYGVSASQYSSMGVGENPSVLAQETRLVGRASLDWQVDRHNRVQAGVDVTRFNDLAWSGPMEDIVDVDAYNYSPRALGLYAQDRIDLGDVVFEAGLRYDLFDSQVLYPRVPGRVYTDPLRAPLGDAAHGTLAQKLAISFNAQDSAMARACQSALEAGDSLALSTCNYFRAAAQHTLSPTLRLSFPVTDRTAFRVSYSRQVQMPDMSLLEARTNEDVGNAGAFAFAGFGRPLGFGSTVLFEMGIRHAFGPDMVLDLSAFNKNLAAEAAIRPIGIFDPATGCFTGACQDPTGTNETVNLVTNVDYGYTRGMDIRFDRRFGTIFSGTVSYTLQTAKTTGSDPYQYVGTLGSSIAEVTGTRLAPPEAFLTSSDSRTHTVAGSLAATFPHGWLPGTIAGAILEDAGSYVTFRFASGLAYTRLLNTGQGTLGPGNGFGLNTPLEPINSSTMPWIKDVDLRVTRGFRLARTSLLVFVDFRNLFNWRNVAAIFAETGDVVNALYQQTTLLPEVEQLQSDAGALWVTREMSVNGVRRMVTGVDLSDCSRYPYAADGSRGQPDCLMLRQDEARWGNGDNFFDSGEINAAFDAWYLRFHGPQTLTGPGFNARLGFEVTF